MLSIVVYGRNDNHGYNLHKRAAVSINCLAEMLRDPADELIFVDYNSPDDLPTFPEAIRDTLTSRAKAVLRILRVRPEVHRRFQQRTHLSVLEPVARNVGVRASNPANRWILSTNTDIILVPRKAQRLSEVITELPSGFYHTARFEIPESLWETFDRADPIGTIEDVRALGVSARLNEVVYGSDPILYDGPGDFQLVERSDLFEIDGFDERMILGWHVDSNLAKRLSLRRGPVASLIEHVFCYHCDHTRQATSTHSRDRLENDPSFFVDQVTRSDLPEQRAHWGCGDNVIEEIKLPQDGVGQYRSMLRSVVAPLDAAFSESCYTTASYNDYGYDARHVLTFLTDLLSCYPREISLGWCGVRRDMFELARQAWRHLGFCCPIAVDAASAPRLITGPSDPAQVRTLCRTAWMDSADLYAFEFGRANDGEIAANPGGRPPELSPEDADALSIVRSGFLATVMHEHTQLAADPNARLRRFVGINCIHNDSEPLFATHIAAAATPFSSRLRHGFVVSATPELAAGTSARLLIGAALGRVAPISRHEFARARDLFGPLIDDGEIAPGLAHRAAINAAIGRAYVKLIGAARVLVVATMPDPAIAAISWRVGRLDVAPAGDCGGSGASSPAFWCAGAPYRPVELKILAAGTRLQQLEPRAYDAVVFPHGALFAAGFDSALDSMAAAERLLRRDGVLVFKAEIAAGAVPHPKFFDTGLLGKDGLTARLAAFTEFVADRGFDPRLSRATVDRTWPQDGPRSGEAYFLTLQDGRILIPSLWFLRRRETAGQTQWGDLRSWLFERRLGEQIEHLHVGPAGRRDAEGRIETVPGREGHVFFGPYLAVPSGRYRVSVRMQTSPRLRYRRASGALLEAVAGRAILANQPFDRNSMKSGVLTMEFAVSPAQAERGEALEFRVYSPSNFAATFTSVDLRASAAIPAAPR